VTQKFTRVKVNAVKNMPTIDKKNASVVPKVYCAILIELHHLDVKTLLPADLCVYSGVT
jgi:hypothetical protein